MTEPLNTARTRYVWVMRVALVLVVAATLLTVVLVAATLATVVDIARANRDCIHPGGSCYEEVRETRWQTALEIRRVVILANACARASETGSTDEIEACVAAGLDA